VEKYLLVRTDRVGDLVLTTPAINALRKSRPAAHITVLASPYAAEILRGHPSVDGIILDKPLPLLARELRAENFDVCVHFFVTFRTALAARLARIPRRIGPASKIWSVFFSERARQDRSSAPGHEADFNLGLLSPLGADARGAKTSLFITPEERAEADRYLARKCGLAGNGELFVLHPGSSGSAPAWPPEHYAGLADKIAASMPEAKVLVTGSARELPLLRRVRDAMSGKAALMDEPVSLRLMMAVIARARLVATNSTGPLHIAVALGTPTVSFYPRLKGCSAGRWGPYGGGPHTVLEPEAGDGRMETITVENAFRAVRERAAGV